MKRLRILLASVVGGSAAILFGPASAQVAAAPVSLDGSWALARPQAVLTPVDGTVPFTAEGRKHYKANKRVQARKHYDYDNAQTLCSTPGLPRLMLTPKRFRIWQRSDLVTFQFEWNRAFYQVDLTGRPSEPLLVGVNNGVSKGTWQGSELVVKSDSFADQTLIDTLVPHSEDLKVTQHFRLVDANTLEDRLTIEDPQTFARPWEAVLTYKRQADAPFPEDVCIDRRRAGDLVLPLK